MIKNKLLLLCGLLFFSVGAIGVVLPFLPTTPFFLLAAFCFTRGSDRFHSWFLNTKIYKKHLREYSTKIGMSKKTKIKVLVTVTLLFALMMVVSNHMFARIVMGVVLLGHYAYFICIRKTTPSLTQRSTKQRLLVMLGKSRWFLVGSIFLRWLALIINIVLVSSFGFVLQSMYENRHSAPLFVRVGLLIIALIILRYFCLKFSLVLSNQVGFEVRANLREEIYNKLLALGIQYRETISSASILQMYVEGVEKLQLYFSGFLPQLFYSILAPLTLFSFFIKFNQKIAFSLLLVAPLIPIAIMIIGKHAGMMMKRHWGKYTDLGKSFLESIRGLTTLKIYNADQRRHEDLNTSSESFRKTTMGVLKMQLGSVTVMDFIAYGGSAFGIWITISEMTKNNLPLWAGVSFILLTADFFIPLRLLGSLFHASMNGISAAEQIFSFIDSKEPDPSSGQLTFFDIHMKNCGYSYQNGFKALENVSLSIPIGDFIAIVGESGSGKSTLAKILAGQFRDYSGSIKIGDNELSEVSESSIVSHISLTNSSPYIFKGTIAENLSLACNSATEEEMFSVLVKTGLSDYVRANGGLSMKISERGTNLSGGQRQRLAIAQALLQKSDIYIFDEATSAVDVENEDLIMNTLEFVSRSKTVLLITHRVKMAQRAKKILVLKNGLPEGFGSHKELYGHNSVYTMLFDAQKEIEDFVGIKDGWVAC